MSDAFENRIREKLNEADIPFDQGAWNKMDQQLNASLRRPGRKGGAWWWPLLLLLLGGGALWYWNQYIPSRADQGGGITDTATSQSAPVATIPPVENSMPDSPATTAVKKGTAQITTAPPVENIVPDSPVITAAKKGTAQIPAVPNVVATLNKPVVKTSGNKSQPANSTIPGAQETASKQQQVPVSIASSNVGNNHPATGMPTTFYGEGINEININKVQDPQITASLANSVKVPLLATSEVASPPASQQRSVRKGISFGLTLGPDFNVAPSLKYGKIGFNAGALLHYQANRHWSFTTGAVYSKKIYGATSGDYAVLRKLPPPTNPGYEVKKVDAVCSVLDVPVNVNYTFLRKQQNTLSGTLGVSNYFMLKENYDYYYANNYPGKKMEFSNENQHYIAILNVALTWQHPVSKHISLGVQPYAKIPFKGVGYGEVKLYSAGLAFQVNFSGVKF